MKLNSKKGTLILGYMESYNDGTIVLKDDKETYSFPMGEKARENFEKCNVNEGAFLSAFVADGVIDNFKFSGKYRLLAEFKKKDSDELYTTPVNVFIGRAARVTEFEKSVQVSMPLQIKGETEWFSLNFWKGTDENHPVDIAEKALLELVPAEGEKKPYFWAVTGAERAYKSKSGEDRTSYTVRQFAPIKFNS